MVLLVFFVLLTLVGSFVFSMMEAVILSVTHIYVEMGVQENKKSAELLQMLKADVDRPLAAILTANTLINTIGSFAIGAQTLRMWGDFYAAAASVGLSMTILIFCEIVPKTIGVNHWRTLAPIAGHAVYLLIYATYPIVMLAEFIADKVGGGHIHKITKEEMIITAEMGAEHGTLNKKETTIIKNLLMLEQMFAYDIMTPKSVIMSLQWDRTVGDVMKTSQPLRYSRIPVFSKDVDHIEGFVHRYKVMEAYSQDKDSIPLKDIMLPIHSVPESITVSAILDQLIHRNEHVFVVTDDYGSTVGLVSLEDAIETLLGVEIVDEFDSVVDLRQHALEQWRKRKRERTLA